MDFGNILARAWQITWKHKALWLFGVLASCGSQGGYGGSGFNYTLNGPQFAPPGTLPPDVERFFFQFERYVESLTPEAIFTFALAVFAIALTFALVFGVLSVYGRVTIIKGTLLADSGSSTYSGLLAREGYAYFWRGLGLNILLGLVLFVVLGTLVFGGVIFSTLTLGIGALCFIPLICLLIPLSILYTVYIQMANVALVSEDLGVFDAMGRGWEAMQGNWGNIILMAIILMIGGGILSFIIAFPLVFAFAPFFLGLISENQDLMGSGFTISAICLVIGIPLIILLNGILRTFIEGAWTLTYQELTSESA